MNDQGASKPERLVLLVDDEPDIRTSLGRFIMKSMPGVRVITAPSGEEGLRLLQEEPVELLISDYKMPGMNGLELLTEARRLKPAVPRILVTAFPDLEVATRAINEARIHNFFTKPFDVVAIMEGIRDSLGEGRPAAPRPAGRVGPM